MKLLICKEWWARAGVRALKTVAQTAIGVIGGLAVPAEGRGARYVI